MFVLKTSVVLACCALLGSVAIAADNKPAQVPESLKTQPFNIQGIEGFNASIGLPADAKKPQLSKKDARDLAEVNYNEKTAQHFMSVHAQKGVTCISCHDQRQNTGVAWMAEITNPPMKKSCQTCHTTQAATVAKADTHSKLDCVACHMPVMPLAADYSPDQAKAAGAVRRAHMYKINTKEGAQSLTNPDGKGYVLAKDEDGNAFVDLMWSCARNTPADPAVFQGQGCHSPYTSTLEEGLVYKDQKKVYGELAKWQNPVKDGYKEITGAEKRIKKLLEVTKLTIDEKTKVLSLLDQADAIATAVKADGSWGAHAQRYTADRIASGLYFIRQAQDILDAAGARK
jgi:hypothetical protein